jgi:hypothetical protein
MSSLYIPVQMAGKKLAANFIEDSLYMKSSFSFTAFEILTV